jgi:hypothetical protein
VQQWEIGRLCEEFHALPLAVTQELRDDPEQLAVRIVELRGFARAKAAYDNILQLEAGARRRLLQDPMVQRVKAVEFAAAEE